MTTWRHLIVFVSLLIYICIHHTSSNSDIPWQYNGYLHLPVMYFGAPVDGIENTTIMINVSNYDISGWGWQTNFTGENEAIYLYNQALSFNNFTKNNINSFNKTQTIFVYRNLLSANAYFNIFKPIISSPEYDGFFIKNSNNKICSQYREYKDIKWLDPIWDFRNNSAQQWLLDNNIIPFYSSLNLFSDNSPCIIKQNVTMKYLSNITWFRYYEYWPDTSYGRKPNNNNFENYLIETQQYNFSNILIHGISYDITNYSLATFLMGQQDYSYYSTSNGWLDQNWKYQYPQYDLIYGQPISKPMKLNDNVYFRSFTHCNVTLDVSQFNASIVHY